MRSLALLAVVLILTGSAIVGAAQNGTNNQTASEGERSSQIHVKCWELKCRFNAENVTVENGTIEDYEWDFDDGSEAEGEVAEHTFPEAGTYNVRLDLDLEDGRRVVVPKTITVDAVHPETSGDIPWTALGIGVVVLGGSLVLARET